jgi:hypothetical protein
MTHWPPHTGPAHWGVGVARGVEVARGVGRTPTQSQPPFALAVHCPSSTGLFGPLQRWPAGHGNRTLMRHGPPHGRSLHCGVGVGCGVAVDAGETGMHPQFPAASAVHSPSSTGMFGPLQMPPAGHGNRTLMRHGPPHGRSLHCGVGVGCGVAGGGGETGTQPQLPAASAVHSPKRATNAASGQTSPGGQVGEITHGPSHEAPEHGAIGVRCGHCNVQTCFAPAH